MATSKAITSSLFTFFVGEEQKRFQVHSRVLGDISAPLGLMTTNGMQESVKKKANLPECSVESFELLLEYAYTGNYHVSANTTDPQVLVSSISTTDLSMHKKRLRPTGTFCGGCGVYKMKWQRHHTCEEPGCDTEAGEGDRCTRCGNLPITVEAGGLIPSFWTFEQAAEGYNKVCYCHAHKAQSKDGDKRHNGSTLSFESVQTSDMPTTKFCIHARLYLIADQYLIEPLKNLCLHKLHRDLNKLDLDQHVDEVVSLLLFVNEHTSEDLDAGIGGGKTLRGLCLAYAVAMRQELVNHDSFKQMIADGGDFVVQFTSKCATL